jgi:hypothetical protein
VCVFIYIYIYIYIYIIYIYIYIYIHTCIHTYIYKTLIHGMYIFTEAAEEAAERSRIVVGAYRHVSSSGPRIDDDHEASLVELSAIQILICVRFVLDARFDQVRPHT